MIRTTQAATLFEAGVKENILPTKARAVVNFRILTADTLTDVENHARKVINDPRVKIAPLQISMEPSAISNSFKLLHRTVRQIIPEAIVAPWLLVAATDSRHYAKLTRSIYRFVPFTLRPDDIQRFHGIDERISVKDYERCVRFFVQLIRNSQS